MIEELFKYLFVLSLAGAFVYLVIAVIYDKLDPFNDDDDFPPSAGAPYTEAQNVALMVAATSGATVS